MTIKTGKPTGSITEGCDAKVIVDTTLLPMAIEHPTGMRLYRKVQQAMVRIAKVEDVELRQSYTRSANAALHKHARHMKAKQFKRAKTYQKAFNVYAGREMRNVTRKLSAEACARHRWPLILADLLLTQRRKTQGTVYSLHAPEVEFITKGKAHKP